MAIRGFLICLIVLAVVALTHAQQPGGDVINTVGQGDEQAVGNSRRWFDAHTDEVKTRASKCLSILDAAKVFQDRALALYAEARKPGSNATALVKQANEQIAQRTIKLEAFKDCVNKAIQAQAQADKDAKAIKRTTAPATSNPKPQPATTTLDKVVDDCFRERMPKYVAVNWGQFGMRDTKPDASDPFGQAFKLASVAARRAISIQEAYRGPMDDEEEMPDYLTGWVTACLVNRGLLPKTDPRIRFNEIIQASADTATRKTEREMAFGRGFLYYRLPPFPSR